MPDMKNETSQEGVKENRSRQEANEGEQVGPPEASAGENESEMVDGLEDYQRKAIEKANKEAASYRRQLRETQEQLEKAVAREDYEEISKQLAATNKELVFERYGIDEELRPLVTGKTVEEWEASAKLIASRLKASNDDSNVQDGIETAGGPKGSRTPPPSTQTMKPAEAARIALSRR